MDEVEKLKTANANLEQRKDELVKELEQVTLTSSMTYHVYNTCQWARWHVKFQTELVIRLQDFKLYLCAVWTLIK